MARSIHTPMHAAKDTSAALYAITGSCWGEMTARNARIRTVTRPHRASQRRAEKRRLNIKKTSCDGTLSQEVLNVSPEEVPSKEGKLAGAGLVAPSHKSDVSLGYAEFKRDLLVRLPRLKLPGNGGLVRLATASVGDCDPKPAVLGNQRRQREYAKDAPKLTRRIGPSRHVYRHAAV